MLIIIFFLVIYCSCWQKYINQQKKLSQSFKKIKFNNISNNKILFDQKNYNFFNLPSIQIQNLFDLSLTKTKNCTTASNNILALNTNSCVPLTSTKKKISFTKSITNKKTNSNNFISDSNAYYYSASPTTNFSNKLSDYKLNSFDYCCSNLPNIYNKKIVSDESKYYSCIQADFQPPKKTLKSKNIKKFNIFSFKNKSKNKSHYQTYFNNKKQIYNLFDNKSNKILKNSIYLNKEYCLNNKNLD